MNEILTAASILLAILMTLYGLYYSDIQKYISITPYKYAEDNRTAYDSAKSVFWSKLFPLLIATLALAFILGPEFYMNVSSSLDFIMSKKFSLTNYNTVTACFCVIYFFICFLTYELSRKCYALNKKIIRLRPK